MRYRVRITLPAFMRTMTAVPAGGIWQSVRVNRSIPSVYLWFAPIIWGVVTAPQAPIRSTRTPGSPGAVNFHNPRSRIGFAVRSGWPNTWVFHAGPLSWAGAWAVCKPCSGRLIFPIGSSTVSCWPQHPASRHRILPSTKSHATPSSPTPTGMKATIWQQVHCRRGGLHWREWSATSPICLPTV